MSTKCKVPDYDSPEEEFPGPGEIDFPIMGGVGILRCNTCGFSAEVKASFPHRNASMGFQCQACGELKSFKGLAPWDIEVDTPCSCGGEFRRDKIVFCPACRSRQMSYDCMFME